MLRKFFVGLPRKEVVKYMRIMQEVEPSKISEEDWAQFEKHSLRSMVIKGIALPTAIWVGYSIPINLLYVNTEFMRVFLGVMIYRALTVPQNHKSFECIKGICLKYNFTEESGEPQQAEDNIPTKDGESEEAPNKKEIDKE